MWRFGPSMTQPRAKLGAVAVEEKGLLLTVIFVTGGCTNYASGLPECVSGATTSTEFLDLTKPNWASGPEMKNARAGHAMASLSGRVYVAGGFNFNGKHPTTTTPENILASVEFLDLTKPNWASGEWRLAPPLPLPSIAATGPRRDFAFASLDGQLFIISGTFKAANSVDFTRSVIVASSFDDDGTPLGWNEGPQLMSKPGGRADFAVATLSNVMYVAGGLAAWSGAQVPTKTGEKLVSACASSG